MAAQPLTIEQAARLLTNGGVLAYPTEAVWGFGCDPANDRAVRKLLALKQRPAAKGLILVGSTGEQFAPFLEGLDAETKALFAAPTERPTSWLVPHNGYASDWIRGDFDSVALRITGHLLVRELCETFGGPIVSSSANLSGQPTYECAEQIQRHIGQGLDGILVGELGKASGPSTVKDLLTGEVLR